MADSDISREHLPHACGVYIMRDAAAQIIYIGKAKDLAKRVSQYFDPSRDDRKVSSLTPLIRGIDYVSCASERESLLLERKLIRHYKPFFNAMWKDDKSYPYVKITFNEDFPRIILTRQRKQDGGLYFGPYPQLSAIKRLLRYLWNRQIFRLRPCRWSFSVDKPLAQRKIRSCLYYHTRQCPAPCAALISKEDYRQIAESAGMFFKGEYALLEKKWRAQMEEASKKMDFEQAAQLRDNLEAFSRMGQRVRIRAVRAEDLTRHLESSRGVTELQQALSLAHPPHHIEAFDISHFAGKQTVASMVCFKGGEPNKDHYRRFRIKTVEGIDDFRSMKEVVGRRYLRLSKDAEPLPDLVLIDGGKGQLGMALRALDELKLKIPLASLAKRIEEIFVPGKDTSLLLEKSSPALQLLQRLRDEAHRFAVTYHKLLRGKKLLESSSLSHNSELAPEGDK